MNEEKASGITYKYKINYLLDQMPYCKSVLIKQKMHLACNVNVSTIKRWRWLKFEDKTEIPTKALLIIAGLIGVTPAELCNYEIPTFTDNELKDLQDGNRIS